MLRDIGGGARDGVTVWHLDRLHRRPIELEQFVQVCTRAGVQHPSLCRWLETEGVLTTSPSQARPHAPQAAWWTRRTNPEQPHP